MPRFNILSMNIINTKSNEWKSKHNRFKHLLLHWSFKRTCWIPENKWNASKVEVGQKCRAVLSGSVRPAPRDWCGAGWQCVVSLRPPSPCFPAPALDHSPNERHLWQFSIQPISQCSVLLHHCPPPVKTATRNNLLLSPNSLRLSPPIYSPRQQTPNYKHRHIRYRCLQF